MSNSDNFKPIVVLTDTQIAALAEICDKEGAVAVKLYANDIVEDPSKKAVDLEVACYAPHGGWGDTLRERIELRQSGAYSFDGGQWRTPPS